MWERGQPLTPAHGSALLPPGLAPLDMQEGWRSHGEVGADCRGGLG